MKEIVRLRQKSLKSGGASLYLDIYADGGRHYEFLNLYLIQEHNLIDKERNKETLRMANVIKTERTLDVQGSRLGVSRKRKNNPLLTDAFMMYAEKRGKEKVTTYTATLRYLKGYDPKVRVGAISPQWAERLVKSLYDKFKQGTARIYASRIKGALAWCFSEGMIARNPFDQVVLSAPTESERQYLTSDELRKMVDADFDEQVRKPFLFSCLTGMRISDIMRLTWANIEEDGGRWRAVIRMKKTKRMLYVEINDSAKALMGERRKGEDKVFEITTTDYRLNLQLARWTAIAGVQKHITFHCARHTFATMLLSNGVDIYTTSKLLGHTNIATTQIYARIIDKKRRDAIDLLHL